MHLVKEQENGSRDIPIEIDQKFEKLSSHHNTLHVKQQTGNMQLYCSDALSEALYGE